MEVAAICLAALDRMRPDPSWTPPLGVLFVRFLVSPWNNEVEFAYMDDPKDPAHYRSIARIRHRMLLSALDLWTTLESRIVATPADVARMAEDARVAAEAAAAKPARRKRAA